MAIGFTRATQASAVAEVYGCEDRFDLRGGCIVKNGIYLLSFEHKGGKYERKVLVEDGFYRFTDERGVPLYNASSLRVSVAEKCGDVFTFIDSVACEMIVWKRVANEQPDDGIMHLLQVPESSVSVYPGYLDGGQWCWADGQVIDEEVLAFAEMPVGLPTGVRDATGV
jgi:hypothetical protein